MVPDTNPPTRIEVGQVWRSKDKRDGGTLVTVLDAGSGDPYVNDYVTVQRHRKSQMRISTLLTRYERVS